MGERGEVVGREKGGKVKCEDGREGDESGMDGGGAEGR